MHWPLFNLMVVTEPDRQRLARFTIEAVDALGGNLFAAAVAIENVLLELHSQAGAEAQIENVTLCVEGQIISLTWSDQHKVLGSLPAPYQRHTDDRSQHAAAHRLCSLPHRDQRYAVFMRARRGEWTSQSAAGGA